MEICVCDNRIALDLLSPILLYRIYSYIRFIYYEKQSLLSSCEVLREIRLIPFKSDICDVNLLIHLW